ncbi:MAG: TIGR02921 family PEP-CTERM protein [Cyanobacteria bacterium P01_E01_bin.34]
MTRLQRLRSIATHLVFWGWNSIFLLIVFAGILPSVGADLFQGLVAGAVPYSIALSLSGLLAVPVVCTVLALFRFRKSSRQLGRFFYGVEAPLFFLCTVRLFLLRELPSGALFVVVTVLLAIAAFLVGLWREGQDLKSDHPVRAWFMLSGQAAVFWVGAYSSLVLLFYVVPVAVWLAIGAISLDWVAGLRDAIIHGGIWVFLSLLLFGFSATLFLGMPVAMCWMYVRQSARYVRQFGGRFGDAAAVGGFIGASVAGTMACLLLQQQPAARALELLSSPPQTDIERQELIAESSTIRAGLRHAYLSSYRYLSTTAENNHIFGIYHLYMGLPEDLSTGLQQVYNRLMAPFLYDGSREDILEAEDLYAGFFDTSIQKGERQAIRKALQSTFNREEAQAGLINIDRQLVLLKQQDVAVKEHDDWADVELHESYQNQTFQDEEIFYSFSLPESAVLTGVWLGNSERLEDRFKFRVSPRGAAQQVYNQEVSRQVDPALLEQVGPRQYRLRAFPIPAKRLRDASQIEDVEQPELHLWMTYRVLQEGRGWPLPTLLEHRNVYWSNQTERTRQGNISTTLDGWLEDYVPATHLYEPKAHEVTLLDQYKLIATPFKLSSPNEQALFNLRLAVLLDRSYSMGQHKTEAAQAIAWLASQFSDSNTDNMGINNEADLYLFDREDAGMIEDLADFDATAVVNYGTSQIQDMLANFQQMKAERNYDAVLVITDVGSYELARDPTPATPNQSESERSGAAKANPPLYIWHVGGELPAAYDDATLDTILTSRGGIATDINGVLSLLEFHANESSEDDSVLLFPRVDNYSWLLTPAHSETPEVLGSADDNLELADRADMVDSSDDGFAAIAARQLILGLSRTEGTSELAQLDRLHEIAKTYEVVSPYSSMIVLVNERQEQDLDAAEAASDRFDREVESGEETLQQPHDPLTVSGVPEPEEWMLLGLMAIALSIVGWRRWMENALT